MKRLAFSGATMILLAASARAEVSVKLNSVQHVTSLIVSTDLEAGSIWGRTSELPSNQLLNPDGDIFGDRLPTYGILALPTQDAAKNPPRLRGRLDPNHRRSPIVAWPRFDGQDWEIVYSVWRYDTSSWSPIDFIERVDNMEDDTDPQLQVNGKRVVLAWRRNNAPGAFALSTATLVPVGEEYDLTWGAPVELVTPPEMNPNEYLAEAMTLAVTGQTGTASAPTLGQIEHTTSDDL